MSWFPAESNRNVSISPDDQHTATKSDFFWQKLKKDITEKVKSGRLPFAILPVDSLGHLSRFGGKYFLEVK